MGTKPLSFPFYMLMQLNYKAYKATLTADQRKSSERETFKSAKQKKHHPLSSSPHLNLSRNTKPRQQMILQLQNRVRQLASKEHHPLFSSLQHNPTWKPSTSPRKQGVSSPFQQPATQPTGATQTKQMTNPRRQILVRNLVKSRKSKGGKSRCSELQQ